MELTTNEKLIKDNELLLEGLAWLSLQTIEMRDKVKSKSSAPLFSLLLKLANERLEDIARVSSDLRILIHDLK